jgi:uncharacterized protein YabE (DUF348 family)
MRISFTSFRTGRFYIIAAGVLLVISLFGLFNRVGAATSDPAHDGRLVTIHDRGEEHVILTHAQTVRDALADAHIPVVDADTVEPGLDEQLVAKDYTVNIYRARQVIVVDGSVREKIMTSAQTSDEIAKAADLSLYDEDKATLTTSTDIIADGASQVLTIDRATAFTLSLYGTVKTAYSQAKTVGDMLNEKGIKLGASDTLSTGSDAPLTDGMSVSIWRNGVQTSTVEEPIAFSVRQVQDADHPVGYHTVQTSGTNGRQSVTYQITMHDGKEVSRTVIQTVVEEQPKEQVEVVGIALPPGSHTDWMAAAGMSPSDYGFIDFIFTHESHWNPASRNPSGLYVGLGQTSPSKLSAACPNWESDPICQIKFFNGYASRYGGWAGSYAHWKANSWW